MSIRYQIIEYKSTGGRGLDGVVVWLVGTENGGTISARAIHAVPALEMAVRSIHPLPVARNLAFSFASYPIVPAGRRHGGCPSTDENTVCYRQTAHERRGGVFGWFIAFHKS